MTGANRWSRIVGNNQARVLAEVLAIDAWHEPFRYDGGTASVHVEMSFRNGRLGGDDAEFPFTFNIALKRALLTIHVETPLAIDRTTIARSIPKDQSEWSKIVALREGAKREASVGGRVSPKSISMVMTGGLKTNQETSKDEELKIIQNIPRILASPIPRGPNEYAWEIIPGHEEFLTGQPWHPVDEPRLHVKPLDVRKAIDPVIKITVACAIADLEITDFELKQSNLKNIAKGLMLNTMNKAAAIQHLKLTLMERHLEVGSLDDRFSDMLIADVLASQA